MKRNNGEGRPGARLETIELDLASYKVLLRFQDQKEPLVIHFDTPARRFYFSLIALVVTEMKKVGEPGFIHIRKHEKTLKLLDHSLAGQHASKTVDGMWGKINQAWLHRLPDLEQGIQFKILERNLIVPREKGGKYRYACSDEECDTWASLFACDETNKWRFKFAVDSAFLSLNDISLTLGDLRDDSAWQALLQRVSSVEQPTHAGDVEVREKTKSRKWHRAAVAVVAILIILTLGVAIRNYRSVPPPAEPELPDKPSIVILPFVNMSNEPDKEYFCDGITEDLINNLARLEDLRVISRTTAFYFKDKNLDIRTIGGKLNVENVLEGSVQISGDKLRITTQLINVADDSHIWAESYDREMKNIFDLQDNVAKEIVCSLKTRLGCVDKSYVKNYTDNVDAYNHYLKGRHLRHKLKQKDMISHFNKAIALDPDYALAYIGLAEAYCSLGFFYGDSTRWSYIRGKEAALKALEIDDTLADGYAALGQIRLFFEWDWKGAETALKKAIEIDPGNSMAHLWYGYYLRAIGRTRDSVDEIKLALDLDLFSFLHNQHYGVALEFDGQIESAIKQAEKTLEIFPENPETLTFLGVFHIQNENYTKGIAILEHALSLMRKRKSSFTLGFLGYAYGRSGDKKNAHRILNECFERWDKGNFTPSTIAVIYTGLNERDKAFAWLNTAIKMHDPRLFCLKSIPYHKPLHSDPRWSELMKRMGLEV